jgi:hypothetical protein
MGKKWLVGCGLAGLLGVVLCGGIAYSFYFLVSTALTITQPVVDGADHFLGFLGQGKFGEAYAETAKAFQAQGDETSFAAAVKQLGLDEFDSATWYNRSLTNNTEGNLEGRMTSKNGGTTPIAVRLVLEDGDWKIVAVHCGGVDLGVSLKALGKK